MIEFSQDLLKIHLEAHDSRYLKILVVCVFQAKGKLTLYLHGRQADFQRDLPINQTCLCSVVCRNRSASHFILEDVTGPDHIQSGDLACSFESRTFEVKQKAWHFFYNKGNAFQTDIRLRLHNEENWVQTIISIEVTHTYLPPDPDISFVLDFCSTNTSRSSMQVI